MTVYFESTKAVVQRCPIKIGVLKNFAKFTGKHLYQSIFLNNTFFTEHLWTTASGGCSRLPRKKALLLSFTAKTTHENGIISPLYALKQHFTSVLIFKNVQKQLL